MPKPPKTLSDWIELMQAAKEKYGDLEVKVTEEDYDVDYYDDLVDVKITCTHSLVKDNEDKSGKFVIVYRE